MYRLVWNIIIYTKISDGGLSEILTLLSTKESSCDQKILLLSTNTFRSSAKKTTCSQGTMHVNLYCPPMFSMFEGFTVYQVIRHIYA